MTIDRITNGQAIVTLRIEDAVLLGRGVMAVARYLEGSDLEGGFPTNEDERASEASVSRSMAELMAVLAMAMARDAGYANLAEALAS